MDLVDIDQVLDNLELRVADEDEEAVSYNKQATQSTSTLTQNNEKNGVGKFIGVSQVFTHLDDYQRNVEALETAQPKYDIDYPLPNRTEELSASAFERPSTSFKTTGATFKLNKDNDDDDEDEENSSDIRKFTENKHVSSDSPDCEDALSDSLTTSSSSTFSSGPSAGAASTTDERLSPILPLQNDTKDAVETVQTAPAEVNTTSQLKSIQQPEPVKVVVEELATGLSSISISSSANSQSILPCENTEVSSALHKVLNELSEPSSISPMSQLREETSAQCEKNTDASKSIATLSPSALNENEVEESENRKVNDKPVVDKEQQQIKCLNGNGKEVGGDISPQLVVAAQQPITFGSTMDEISDTELDSMLQEMDIDADVDDVKVIPKLTEPCLPTTTNQNPISTEQIAQPITDSKHEKLANGTQEAIPEENEVLTADSVNADSFSQASTVEFSEIHRATNAAIVSSQAEDVNPHYNNSCTSSDSSSLDGEHERYEADGEAGVDENGVSLRPQRPTTLNLPNLTTSLHTNAGQTPPGATENVGEMQTNAESDATNNVASQEIAEATGYSDPNENLGRVPPIWVPDNMATSCMQCQTKFTMIKRRHHCRACGKVLCSVCCSQKFKLEFSNEAESRVCVQCYLILAQRQQNLTLPAGQQTSTVIEPNRSEATAEGGQVRSPNPNNPMEYCSTIPPHRQVSAEASALPPPTVIVPVGVLKKDGSYSSNSSNSSSKQTRKRKSVMFSDGIAPGSDLAGMEQHQWGEAKHARRAQGGGRGMNNKPSTPVKAECISDATTMGMVAQLFRGSIPPTAAAATVCAAQAGSVPKTQRNASPNKVAKGVDPSAHSRLRRLPPSGSDDVGCFIPPGDKSLPPLYVAKDETGCEFDYKEISNNFELIERLQQETLKFAVTRNFFIYVKIQNLKCCLNRTVINFTTSGMHHVGNDEIIMLLEFDPPKSKELLTEPPLPKDIFVHLHEIYREAEMGNPIAELSYTCPRQERFLGVHDYGGFIFIRPTFQCMQDVILPENPFLIGILIHRSEVPWAKVFPLRLMLRLGAQYRYYPCPHVSMRHRDSVYAEIAQTIINFLADFRNYSYTLPNIRGMFIHMEDRQTTVLIPRNRQEDVIKAMNNSSDHILAFGGNFSKAADGHLVCMQNTNDDRTEMYSYSTQAINIQGQPRKVTGASFFVLNESLKSTSGLSAKCSIVEDGLMVQILPSKMAEVRNSLSTQKDVDIVCGPVNAEEQQKEIVTIKWVDNDKDFNIGVKSPIDEKSLEGISSMRVHASFNYANANYSIRLTDIFILKFDDWYSTQAALVSSSADITRISEQVARSASMALVPFLDLLAASGNNKIGLRVTLHHDNVCYEAGARFAKLPPLYMNALDNSLIPTLHNESTGIEDAIILELIFYILNA